MKKTKKYFIYSTIIVLFTALFFACKNDFENAVSKITGTPDSAVLDAQAWYNSTIKQDTLSLGLVKVKGTKKNMAAKPDWKHTYTIREKDYTAVHVQLFMKGTFSFVTPENKKAYEATGNERYIKTFTRMVVLTNKKDKKTTGFLMTLIPDKAYIESTHFDALRSNYKQWQKGFSGFVFYHTLDGKFANGWQFADGKAIKVVTQNSDTDLNVNMGAKKKVAAETQCTDYYYEMYAQDCTDWTSNGEYVTTVCGGVYFDGYEYAYTVCTYTDTNKITGDYDGGGHYGGHTYYDCNGDANGSAYYDNCQVCVGGNTGKKPCIDPCETSGEDLKKAFPNVSDSKLAILADKINTYSDYLGIHTKEQLQHFIAQAACESNDFATITPTEKLNYTSAERLSTVFPKYFSLTDMTKQNPYEYLNNPEKLANLVYSNRMGNGNENSGDGYKYRGRGIFQLTGKDNYQKFSAYYTNELSYIDIVSNPNLLSSDQTLSIVSALWYYKTRVLDKIQVNENTSVAAVSILVNGGTNGLASRKSKFNLTKQYIDCK